ncbi:MAG: hypothetical protein ACYCV4_02500 [Dermatophilaceae bacterium]
MATIAAIVATIAGVAIVFQLAKNVAGSGQAPVTGLGTTVGGAKTIVGDLFSK